MVCTPTELNGELEFAQVVTRTRSEDQWHCCGPLVALAFRPFRVFVLECIWDSQVATDQLWDGFWDTPGSEDMWFELCAGHWMDLITLCGARAQEYHRRDWYAQASQLLIDLCTAVRWDWKEVSNMFAWQREKLT